MLSQKQRLELVPMLSRGPRSVREGNLETSSSRVLVVEDSEPFRNFICSTLGRRPELQIVGDVMDGLQAVHTAQALRPDLIVLDIGLPSLNGIEVARRIRKVSPKSKILFVSQESSAVVVREALDTGAHGYVLKTDAGRELLDAVSAVLRGERFVGKRFSGHDFVGGLAQTAFQQFPPENASAPIQRGMEIARRHEVGFYSDDQRLLDHVTQFIGDTLASGDAAVVVASKSHRDNLVPRLQAQGLDIDAANEQGRFISIDVADMLSAIMIDGMPDPGRFFNLFNNLIVTAADAAKREQARVAVFGEGVHLLCERGDTEAAIRVERLTKQIAKTNEVNILCGYCLGPVMSGMDSHLFQRICEEHSTVYCR